jgi:hypothetical protein
MIMTSTPGGTPADPDASVGGAFTETPPGAGRDVDVLLPQPASTTEAITATTTTIVRSRAQQARDVGG